MYQIKSGGQTWESFWIMKLTLLDPEVTWSRLEIDFLLMKWLGLTWLEYNQLVT